MSPTSLLIFIFNAITIAPICHVFPLILLLLPRRYHLTSKAELTLFHLEGSDWVLICINLACLPMRRSTGLPTYKMFCLPAPVISLPTSTEHPRCIRTPRPHTSQHDPEAKNAHLIQAKVLSLPSSCSRFCHFKFSGHFLLTYGVPLCCMC